MAFSLVCLVLDLYGRMVNHLLFLRDDISTLSAFLIDPRVHECMFIVTP